tara:strand:+ start:1283 stop:1465 length:183 start_codon:yes stop_codon:yes gene_type:complete
LVYIITNRKEIIMQVIYKCFRCADKIDFKKVSDGYFGACLSCDEDFYEFECNKIITNRKE